MEPSLSLKKSDYESAVGTYRGKGAGVLAGEAAWNTRTTNEIQQDVASGLRRFYYCGFPWSFLRPFLVVTLLEGETTVQMPDDFGGYEGDISVSLDSNIFAPPLEFSDPTKVLQLFSESPSMTGRPQVISLRPVKTMPINKGQRQELYVFPEADQDYTLSFQSYVNPNYLLESTMPYAYGGAEHSETILESCLAIAEERRDNSLSVHKMAFMELLEKSKQLDCRKKPHRIGYNGDNSDNVHGIYYGRGLGSGDILINGVSYD